MECLYENVRKSMNVMNSEIKVILFSLLDEDLKSIKELYGELEELLEDGEVCEGKEKLWIPKKREILGYLDSTMIKSNFLEKECIEESYTVGNLSTENITSYWKLNENGMKYGRSLAGLVLDYCFNHEHTLYELLGHLTANRKTNSPLNRMRIFLELGERPKREIELSGSLGLDRPMINRHMKHLESSGFVESGRLGSNGNVKRYWKLTEEGFEVLNGFVRPYISILSGDAEEIERAERALERIQLNPGKYYSKILRNFSQKSPNLNRRKDKIEETIIKYLKENPGAHETEIAGAMNISESYACAVLKEMFLAGGIMTLPIGRKRSFYAWTGTRK